jgi:hypothetical protein
MSSRHCWISCRRGERISLKINVMKLRFTGQ